MLVVALGCLMFGMAFESTEYSLNELALLELDMLLSARSRWLNLDWPILTFLPFIIIVSMPVPCSNLENLDITECLYPEFCTYVASGMSYINASVASCISSLILVLSTSTLVSWVDVWLIMVLEFIVLRPSPLFLYMLFMSILSGIDSLLFDSGISYDSTFSYCLLIYETAFTSSSMLYCDFWVFSSA